jgi:hypothetical protein
MCRQNDTASLLTYMSCSPSWSWELAKFLEGPARLGDAAGLVRVSKMLGPSTGKCALCGIRVRLGDSRTFPNELAFWHYITHHAGCKDGQIPRNNLHLIAPSGPGSSQGPKTSPKVPRFHMVRPLSEPCMGGEHGVISTGKRSSSCHRVGLGSSRAPPKIPHFLGQITSPAWVVEVARFPTEDLHCVAFEWVLGFATVPERAAFSACSKPCRCSYIDVISK